MDRIMNINELEIICQTCNGSGRSEKCSGFFGSLLGIKDECVVCDGKGRILTAKGRELVEFAIRHITTGMDGGGLHKKPRR